MNTSVIHFNNVLADMVDNFKLGTAYATYLKFNRSSDEFIKHFMTIDPDYIKTNNVCVFEHLGVPFEYSNLDENGKVILWKYLDVLQQLTETYCIT